MKRFALRFLFAVLSAALLYVLIEYPAPGAALPTLRTAAALPHIRAATPAVRSLTADTPAPAAAPTVSAEPEAPEPAEPGDIFVFMYHDLTENEAETGTWCTTPEQMRSDLETILSYGYLPLSLEDYVSGNYEIGPDYFIVTFDDGYISNLTLAEPVLAEMGISAAVFVITGSTELPSHMSWEQLAELKATGTFTVYSHTHSHLNNAFSSSNEAFLADEALAWQDLTEHLGEIPYRILSYPNGDYTFATMRALAAGGYDLFVIQNIPGWYSDDNPYGIRILSRMNVSANADMPLLVNFNRRRFGFNTIEAALAERQAEADAALAERRAARRAWLDAHRSTSPFPLA